jgi:hypothetical protein
MMRSSGEIGKVLLASIAASSAIWAARNAANTGSSAGGAGAATKDQDPKQRTLFSSG